MKLIISLFTLWVISLRGFAGDVPTVKVVSVIDGNTIEVLNNNGEQYKVLLFGIDSPDSGQHFALEAKQALAKLILDKRVTLVMRGKDRYGNMMGEIMEDGGIDVNFEMVVAGLAWTTGPDVELETLKQHARDRGIGLWTEENPTPPWLWRRQQSMLQSKSN